MSNLPNDLPTYGVNVRDYGARGDGASDDAPFIQKALDAGRGLVTVPYGTYRIGRTLRVPAHTHMRVHPRARLFLAEGAGVDQDSFLLTNQREEEAIEDIRIEGGIWDGNNVHNPRGPDQPGSYTGVLMNFAGVRGLVLRALTLRDPEAYYIRLGQIRDFHIDDIRLEAPHPRPNQDGVHLGGDCADGVIRNVHGIGPGVPYDDLVALNADDANHRAQNLGKQCGPIRRIRVENLTATDCHTFVRLLSVRSPIEDIDIRELRGGCRVAALNLDACRECRVPLFDPDDPQSANGVGEVARILVRDVHVYKADAAHRKPLVDLRTRVRDFRVENFIRDMAHDANPDAATLLLAGIGASSALVAGLTTDQLAALHKISATQSVKVHVLASLEPTSRYRGLFTLSRDGRIVLPFGGWSTLSVNSPETNRAK